MQETTSLNLPLQNGKITYLTLEYLIFAGLLVTLGSLVQSTIGFGLAIIAAPFLMWLDARLVPGPLLIVAFFISALNTWKYRQAIVMKDMTMALVGRLPGTGIAMLVLGLVDRQQLMILVGCAVLFAVAVSLGRWRIEARPGTLFMAGVFSGFMGTTTSIGGPPIALVYQNEASQKMRANLSAFFTISCAISLAALGLINHLDRMQILQGVALIPFSVIGFIAASRFIPFVQGPWPRRAILLLCAISGVGAIVFSGK